MLDCTMHMWSVWGSGAEAASLLHCLKGAELGLGEAGKHSLTGVASGALETVAVGAQAVVRWVVRYRS